MKKRILSILLLCCMVLTMQPVPAFAAEGETGARASNPGGLCEHHPEHDEACGYTEGTAEIPCSHEHTEECHSLITRCVHAHTAECYPAESGEAYCLAPLPPAGVFPHPLLDECDSSCGYRTYRLPPFPVCLEL